MNFQRTTAGGICDCGDREAWKSSGFCSKHPGISMKSDQLREKAIRMLPLGIKELAPMIIDVVVQHIFEAITFREESFELAIALSEYHNFKSVDTSDKPSSSTSGRNYADSVEFNLIVHNDESG